MQIKFDPSAKDESHSIEIPAMVIEGREECDRIVASLQKRAAVLWPKPRAPRVMKGPPTSRVDIGPNRPAIKK